MTKFFKKAMDPISSETHFIGACLSFVGLVALIVKGISKNTTPFILGASIVFGISLIALYSASAIYHFFDGNEKTKKILRKLDHSMIYVLIVGTYTPIIVYCMEIPKAYYFLAILWSIALIGIIVKICWLNAPRVLTVGIYLVLGWAIVFDFQAFSGISSECLVMIAAGGIAYSIGAVIYVLKKPNFSPAFGFHELFHIFVMLGSLLHYLAIFMFVL